MSDGGGTISINDADASPSNELQTFSIDCNDNLILSQGNSIKIPGITAANETTNPTTATIQNMLNNGSSPSQVKIQYPCLTNSSFYGYTYQGGIIFYFTGSSGKVCAPSDQSTSASWNNGVYVLTGSGNTWGSEAETSMIISSQGAGTYAASICSNLVIGVYSDWYFPNWIEIANMSSNLGPNGTGQLSGTYWCAWEEGITNAHWITMGGTNGSGDKSQLRKVRAVRNF